MLLTRALDLLPLKRGCGKRVLESSGLLQVGNRGSISGYVGAVLSLNRIRLGTSRSQWRVDSI